MEYLHVLAKKWRYFLFLSFLEGKKEEEKERKSDEIEAELQNDLDKLNDQYANLKLSYDEIDEENTKLKNGELYVEMQKKSLMN